MNEIEHRRRMTSVAVLSLFLSVFVGVITIFIVKPSTYMETNVAILAVVVFLSYFVFLGIGYLVVKKLERDALSKEKMLDVAGFISALLGFASGVVATIILDSKPDEFLVVLLGIGGIGFLALYGVFSLAIEILSRRERCH